MTALHQRLLVAAYLASAVIANLAVAAFGPIAVAPSSVVLVGLDLTARDLLHDAWTGRRLPLRMGALIATGSAISYLLNRSAGRIALASFVSFASAAIADTVIYELLRGRRRLIRINGSNLGSAALDSLLFPTLAFGALLPLVIAGQFVAKVGGGFAWSLLFHRLHRRSSP